VIPWNGSTAAAAATISAAALRAAAGRQGDVLVCLVATYHLQHVVYWAHGVVAMAAMGNR
jgi:hypothetical protein